MDKQVEEISLITICTTTAMQKQQRVFLEKKVEVSDLVAGAFTVF